MYVCAYFHTLYIHLYTKMREGDVRGEIVCACIHTLSVCVCVEEASHCTTSASCPRNLCVGGIGQGVVAVLLSGQEVVTISLLTTHWPIQM